MDKMNQERSMRFANKVLGPYEERRQDLANIARLANVNIYIYFFWTLKFNFNKFWLVLDNVGGYWRRCGVSPREHCLLISNHCQITRTAPVVEHDKTLFATV